MPYDPFKAGRSDSYSERADFVLYRSGFEALGTFNAGLWLKNPFGTILKPARAAGITG